MKQYQTQYHYILQIIALLIITIIIGQTLPFKFLGREESVILFTKLGIEPRGRIGTGIIELISIILIWIPSWRKQGIFMVIALMAGALLSHSLILGRDKLVIGAIVSMCCALYVIRSLRQTKQTQQTT